METLALIVVVVLIVVWKVVPKDPFGIYPKK